MVRGKKPTAEQRKILVKNNHDPSDWFYVSQVVRGDSGYKRLGKDEVKTTCLVFRNRVTNQEIELSV